jgi:hypothetical protein
MGLGIQLGDFRDKEVGNMWKMNGIIVSAVVALAVAGCGKSDGTKRASTSAGGDGATAAVAGVADGNVKLEPPAAATQEFLEALRTGNDDKAVRMLSTVAREKAASLNRNVTPAASDTARFAVGKVEYKGEYGARVACTWTDRDEEGKWSTDTAVWVLRREAEGWRIAGVAAQVFPDHDPIVLNFEDPEDLLKQQQWVRAEMQRRMEESGLQAKEDGKPENQIRR